MNKKMKILRHIQAVNDTQSVSGEFVTNHQDEPVDENEYGLMVSEDHHPEGRGLRSEAIENEHELDDEDREAA